METFETRNIPGENFDCAFEDGKNMTVLSDCSLLPELSVLAGAVTS